MKKKIGISIVCGLGVLVFFVSNLGVHKAMSSASVADGTANISSNDITGNEVVEGLDTVSAGDVSEGDVSEGDVSEGDISEGDVSDNDMCNIVSEKKKNFAIADVDRYVNVRNKPSTEGEIVGKIYDDAIAEVIALAGEQEDWLQITSGNVEGYVKAEYFIYGDDAESVLDQYRNIYVEVKAERLNVRAGQSTEDICIGKITKGKRIKFIEDCGDWIHVQYTEQKEGYVSSEYVEIVEEYLYAKTLEEEQAEIQAKKASQQEKYALIQNIVFPDTSYTSNEELRKNIVNYALQYVGNKYVGGGTSLESGTDCSGFTCFIYADFGYEISRIPDGQYTGAGRSIDYSEIQPGDIICYSSNGGKSCTHVALYIGDGQVVHAANPRKGVITSKAEYEPIIGIKNVID